jgi:hypothetical protein
MIGITLTTDQIRNAPAQVRQWIEHEVIASLGLAADAPAPAEHPHEAHLVACTTEDAAAVLAQIRGMMPAFNVFFEFARPGISFGQPPVMAFRLIDILYHTRLQDIGQVIECLEAINEPFVRVGRVDASQPAADGDEPVRARRTGRARAACSCARLSRGALTRLTSV